jgi:Tol biopolymer transport system component
MGFQGPKEVFKKLLDTYKLTFDHTNGTIELPIAVKTADATLTRSDSGKIITTYGDGDDIEITLPTAKYKGFFCLIVQSTDNELKVTAGTADTLITHNDAAADSVSFTSASNQIGQAVLILCDGNAYYALQVTAGTFTVGT